MAPSFAHSAHCAGPLARALVVAFAPALLLGFPAAGRAQSASPATPPAASPASPASALEQFASLELTAAQRKSIDSLAAAARSAREALMAKRGGDKAGAQAAPPQGAANAAGGGPTIGMSFSEPERKELQRIATEFEAGLQRVLTAAQREKLAAAREAMRQRYAAQAEAAAKEAHAKRPTKPPADLQPPSGAAPTTPPSASSAPRS